MKRNSNYDEEEDLEKPTVLEMYMVRTKSDVWDSPYDFEMVKHDYGLFNMSLYEFAKTFYVRNKKAGGKIYHLKKHIKNNTKNHIFCPTQDRSKMTGENCCGRPCFVFKTLWKTKIIVFSILILLRLPLGSLSPPF